MLAERQAPGRQARRQPGVDGVRELRQRADRSAAGQLFGVERGQELVQGLIDGEADGQQEQQERTEVMKPAATSSRPRAPTCRRRDRAATASSLK